jgi:hypothetical protein
MGGRSISSSVDEFRTTLNSRGSKPTLPPIINLQTALSLPRGDDTCVVVAQFNLSNEPSGNVELPRDRGRSMATSGSATRSDVLDAVKLNTRGRYFVRRL